MSRVGLTAVEGTKTIYALGKDVTVRGWATPRKGRFANHVVLGIRGTDRWTELLVRPEGDVVATGSGRTEQDAYGALNRDCQARFGEPYAAPSDGPFDWR